MTGKGGLPGAARLHLMATSLVSEGARARSQAAEDCFCRPLPSGAVSRPAALEPRHSDACLGPAEHLLWLHDWGGGAAASELDSEFILLAVQSNHLFEFA